MILSLINSIVTSLILQKNVAKTRLLKNFNGIIGRVLSQKDHVSKRPCLKKFLSQKGHVSKMSCLKKVIVANRSCLKNVMSQKGYCCKLFISQNGCVSKCLFYQVIMSQKGHSSKQVSPPNDGWLLGASEVERFFSQIRLCM